MAGLIEAIKCHHNKIALYIENNLMNERNSSLIDEIFDCSLRYSNYSFLPLDIADEFIFFFFIARIIAPTLSIFIYTRKKKKWKSL